jgi:hypothetical protein
MEIGSFLELDLRNTGEYFQESENVARLNTGRSAIYHAICLLNVTSIYLPFYLCPTVKSFLIKKGINVMPYYIKNNFEPILPYNDKSTSVLIVNYYGIIPNQKILEFGKRYQNVIMDNCQAFFSSPIENCFNIYSTRKFFGVPDGSYVVGPGASRNLVNYRQDISSDNAGFLLKRIEKGCTAVYAERMKNEDRLDHSDIMQMSSLTRIILNSIDYEHIKIKRLENFNYAHSLFRKYNALDTEKHVDRNCVPMVYPLIIEDEDLVDKLKNEKIYTGRWWNSVLNDVTNDRFEANLSRFMVPLPIDQRYSRKEIDFIFSVFRKEHAK